MSSIKKTSGQISLTLGQDTKQTYPIHRAEVIQLYKTIGSYQAPTGQMPKEISVKEQTIMKCPPPTN